MAAVREVKKEVDNDLEATKRISKAAARKMFAELTKGQNMRPPSITPEQIAQAVTKSVSGVNGVDQEALNQFGKAFQALLESALTRPAAKKRMKHQTNDQLYALAQKGDAEARSLLLEQNMGFLLKTAGELYRSMDLAQSDLCVDYKDLVQEGSIGLLSAAAGFDAARSIKFLTYAAPVIRNAMTDFIRAEFSQFKQKVVRGENELGIQIIRLEDAWSEEEQA